MLGAIAGDIIGSPYEFDSNCIKTEDFELFIKESRYTDDTVMTCAVAEAILVSKPNIADDLLRSNLVEKMRYWGKKYPNAGYGGSFYLWLYTSAPQPYNSWGNGAAMRVSSVAWLFDSMEDVLHYARLTADVTHNHPEGIKGAQATALCIYLARKGYSKDYIKTVVTKEFGYNLDRTIDEIRPTYKHIESCQESVPEAIIAYLEGDSFEGVVRKAVSLGGDSDTLAAIAGSIAEATYGIPTEIAEKVKSILPKELLSLLEAVKTSKE